MLAYKVYAQDFEHLCDALLNPAPELLDMNVLKSYPKFRTIFHDTFCRRDTVTNFLQAYKEIKSSGVNARFCLDMDKNGTLTCISNMHKNQRLIETIDTKRSNYGILVNRQAETSIAFRIKDINNLYSVTFYDRVTSVSIIKNGRSRKIATFVGNKSYIAYLYVNDNMLYVYDGYIFVGKCRLYEFANSTRCGLIVQGKMNYGINEFVINYLDTCTNNVIDDYIETGIIDDKQFGHWQAEKGLITVNSKHTSNSRYSLRFQLDYYSDWEKHKVALNRRTEICPKAKIAKPLDSWISSFDIYFPGMTDGEEYYAADQNDELFWQSHDNGAAVGLSPHVALYLKNDIIRFQTLSRGELRSDKKNVLSNQSFGLDGVIARLVNEYSSNPSIYELLKGKWHNFTIYIKEGYTDTHLPRSIVYIDGKKVIDWNIVNAYNCEDKAEYLKMGIYKWPWACNKLKGNVRKRILYYDNIIYLR